MWLSELCPVLGRIVLLPQQSVYCLVCRFCSLALGIFAKSASFFQVLGWRYLICIKAYGSLVYNKPILAENA